MIAELVSRAENNILDSGDVIEKRWKLNEVVIASAERQEISQRFRDQ